jgi:hypothetical protein
MTPISLGKTRNNDKRIIATVGGHQGNKNEVVLLMIEKTVGPGGPSRTRWSLQSR